VSDVAIECERWQWRELLASEEGPEDPSTRLVLFVLALHMNQQGLNAFPSQETIAKRSGLSARAVRTHLRRAEKAHWLKIYQKPRKGQAWFVHEYVACIPDNLIELCTSKPWEEDPNWQRAEDSSGRRDEAVDKPPQKPQHPANGAGHPAIHAQRAANGSERAAIDDRTGGNLRHDARNRLPTNSSSNSSLNSSSNSPINTPVEGAVASDRTALSKTLNLNPSKTPDPEAEKTASKERAERARKAIKTFADYADADIAKVARVSLEEVQQVRRSA
jgi:hypothetical protein